MDKLISVICTVKNGESTIGDTIESVLNQTYKKIEFIIIDDGSKDNTVDILNSFIERDNRIKLFVTEGIGRAKALNKALKNSKGEFIANIDADDMFHPQKLEIQMKTFNELKGYFLVSTNSKIIYDDEVPDWDHIKINNNLETETITKKLLIKNIISHPSVIMRREYLKELGGYNEKRTSQLDYDLWLRAYTNKYKMSNVNQELVAKRIHSKQSFENKNRLKYTYNSMTLKLKYLLANKKYVLAPLPILSFLIAQLPFKFRRYLNFLLFSK